MTAIERLAAAVRAHSDMEWTRTTSSSGLLLPVRFRPARGTDPGPLALTGKLSDIVQAYRSVPSGRLVVLGAAGSGKTFLTLRFVRDWLDDRAPDDPIPVVFGLGSWDPKTTSLRDWMCDQLVRDYGLAAWGLELSGRDLAGALVDTGFVLPVLDGFDEIASGLQDQALDKLNATTTPLLLTSRREWYARAVAYSDALSAAAVIELEALDLDDVADFLSRAGGRELWEPVRARLRDRSADNVASVLTTPQMVVMARVIYSDTSGRHPCELLDTDLFPAPDDLERHLLSVFVPSVYARWRILHYNRRRRWDSERVHHWLGYLAVHLTRLNTYDLAWWQLGTTLRRSIRVLMVGFLAALAFGVTTVVGNLPVDLVTTSHGARFVLVRGLVVGLLHGLVAGLCFGMVYVFAFRGAVEPLRVSVYTILRWIRPRYLLQFTVGLAFGALAALLLVLVDRGVVEPLGLGGGLDGGLVFVPVFALGAGLAFGLIALLEVPVDIDSAASPSGVLNASRRGAVFSLFVWLLVLGGAGLVFGLGAGLTKGLMAGLVLGIGCGLGYGLTMTAWGRWVALARIYLPLTGQLPWALTSFLDEACRWGVLRQAGAVYQFRSLQLQRRLAAEYRESK